MRLEFSQAQRIDPSSDTQQKVLLSPFRDTWPNKCFNNLPKQKRTYIFDLIIRSKIRYQNCWDILTDPVCRLIPRQFSRYPTLPTGSIGWLRRWLRQWLPIMAVDNIWSKVCRPNRSILFPTNRAAESISPTHCRRWQSMSDRPSGRTHITDSLLGVAADIRLPQGIRPADGVSGSLPDIPTAGYRHIVGQPTQTLYDRYEQLSCQRHTVWPPWGIVLPRT